MRLVSGRGLLSFISPDYVPESSPPECPPPSAPCDAEITAVANRIGRMRSTLHSVAERWSRVAWRAMGVPSSRTIKSGWVSRPFVMRRRMVLSHRRKDGRKRTVGGAICVNFRRRVCEANIKDLWRWAWIGARITVRSRNYNVAWHFRPHSTVWVHKSTDEPLYPRYLWTQKTGA